MTEAPITNEEIKLWWESTPADYKEWDVETIAGCNDFLLILLERLDPGPES